MVSSATCFTCSLLSVHIELHMLNEPRMSGPSSESNSELSGQSCPLTRTISRYYIKGTEGCQDSIQHFVGQVV